jgi:CheY-like chemotaxis protein
VVERRDTEDLSPTVRPTPTDLNAVVLDAADAVRRALGDRVDLRLHTDGTIPVVDADPYRVTETILRVARSVCDHLVSGGWLVLATSARPADPEAAAVLSISASSGVDEVLSFRASPPSPGSWHLPGPAGTVLGPWGTELILLVEDDDAVREVVQVTLSQRGYRVVDAASPAEAFSLVDGLTERIDLILSDVIMPGMSGPEMVARLHHRLSGCRVLYMSGYPNALRDRGGPAQNAPKVWLQKPFSSAQLLTRVRAVLDDRE